MATAEEIDGVDVTPSESTPAKAEGNNVEDTAIAEAEPIKSAASDKAAAVENGVDVASAKSGSPDSANSADTEDPVVAALKAKHTARSARRAGRRSGTLPPSSDTTPSSSPAVSTSNSLQSLLHADTQPLTEEIQRLKAVHKVEMQSLRRNHIENLKRVTEERDMFAAQLAKEQESASTGPGNSRELADLNAQLRASRIRTTELQAEVERLQNENKQLMLRVQATKTLGAESNTYDKLIEELVAAKLKCAEMEEVVETHSRTAREAKSAIAMLRDANGELEKSRQQWVVQCADLERKRADLEAAYANSSGNGEQKATANGATNTGKTNNADSAVVPSQAKPTLVATPDADASLSHDGLHGVPLD